MFPVEMPILEIDNTNIEELWPRLILAIRISNFVALDTELSGLGKKGLLQTQNLEERYKAICDAAQTRSIIALGVSCFKCKHDDASTRVEKPFSVQTFNILMFCSEEYVVDTSSIKFLVEHGFDFNKQYSCGVNYARGNKDEGIAKENSNRSYSEPYLKMLMDELVTSDATIVLHNSLMDLVFLYSNLYCQLPSSIATFVSDLNLMFRGGIFDTKVISEFKNKMRASFLEYVFKKCFVENERQYKQKMPFSSIEFLNLPVKVMKHIALVNLYIERENFSRHQVICDVFASHGWCINGSKCLQSHSVDLIIHKEFQASLKTQKQKLKKIKLENNPSDRGKKPEAEDSSNAGTVSVPQCKKAANVKESSKSQKTPDCRSHRAGFDAFMTGFVFSYFLAKYSEETEAGDSWLNFMDDESDPVTPEVLQRWNSWGSFPKDFRNKVYLSGKDFPLQIAKSAFVKPSKLCLNKLKNLRM